MVLVPFLVPKEETHFKIHKKSINHKFEYNIGSINI